MCRSYIAAPRGRTSPQPGHTTLDSFQLGSWMPQAGLLAWPSDTTQEAVCVCMHVCNMCVCMCLCMYACTCVCVLCTCARLREHVCAHMCVCSLSCVCPCISRVRACVYAHVCTRVCAVCLCLHHVMTPDRSQNFNHEQFDLHHKRHLTDFLN